MSGERPTLESLIPSIEAQIDKRKGSWRLASVAWEDVKQMILIRVCVKYDSPTGGFKPEKGKFSHWLSRVTTRAMTNILRDSHTKFSRPCVTGCVFNTGGDSCSRTKSGIQCAECPIYKLWEQRKLDHYRVQQTLPLENHAQEVNSMQSDFIDIEGSKHIIDARMKDKLDEGDYAIYQMIYIEGKTEKEVGKLLGYKKTGAKTYEGYQVLLKLRKHIVEMAREIIEEENLT
jgi:DNA-directed RNA polymerase specialized sigma24 family protein